MEFAETLPVIAGAGSLASVAARLMRDALQLCAGIPAVAVALPDEVAVAGSLLRAIHPSRSTTWTASSRTGWRTPRPSPGC
jgi:hypothetical protein